MDKPSTSSLTSLSSNLQQNNDIEMDNVHEEQDFESTAEVTRQITRLRIEIQDADMIDDNPQLRFLKEGIPIPDTVPNLDDYTVAFNGPDDPTNPQNWSSLRKLKTTMTGLITTLCVTFSSSAYTPSVEFIAAEFRVLPVVAMLGLSFFVLGFATGPVIGGPLSELFGRKKVMLICVIGFVLFEFAVATAKDLQTVLLGRFFASAVGASVMVVTPGCFADMYSNKRRGTLMNCFAVMVFVFPILGPVIGGFISYSYLGWRWTQYISGIFGAACLFLVVFIMEETHHGIILSNKAETLRRITKVWAIHAAHEEISLSLKDILEKNIMRPMKMLVKEPILLLITIYVSFVYGMLYLLLPAYPVIFAENYKMKGGVAELPYLALAIGIVLGGAFCIYCERYYLKDLILNNYKPVPESRLLAMKVGCIIFPIGLFWFFWTGNYPDKVHWIVPTVAGLPIGFGFITIFTTALNYLIDTYLFLAASAMAANTFLRSAFAAAFPLFATFMLHNLGVNWSGLLLGLFGIVLCPVPFIFSKYGKRIRGKSKYAFDLS